MAFGKKNEPVFVTPPALETVKLTIRGTAPLVLERFSNKARDQMRETQEAGAKGKSKKQREPKDFEAAFKAAQYVAKEGWLGINANAFRAAMLSACRVAGMVMSRTKLTIAVIPDGFDDDGIGLTKITKGQPKQHVQPLPNATGVMDLRSRPMWAEGWEAKVTVSYDSEQIDAQSVVNLLSRAGAQVGIGAGRPDSRHCGGCGWGLFEVLPTGENKKGKK